LIGVLQQYLALQKQQAENVGALLISFSPGGRRTTESGRPRRPRTPVDRADEDARIDLPETVSTTKKLIAWDTGLNEEGITRARTWKRPLGTLSRTKETWKA